MQQISFFFGFGACPWRKGSQKKKKKGEKSGIKVKSFDAKLSGVFFSDLAQLGNGRKVVKVRKAAGLVFGGFEISQIKAQEPSVLRRKLRVPLSA